MRAAVAYSLGGDEAAVDSLREHYAAKMKASPDAKTFAVGCGPLPIEACGAASVGGLLHDIGAVLVFEAVEHS